MLGGWLPTLTDKERRGAAAALLALLIGLLVSRIVADSVTFVALIVLPLVVYSIVAGKLKEFSAPGGWGAKFEEIAAEKVKPSPITDSVQNLDIFSKGGVRALANAVQDRTTQNPIALTLTLGKTSYTPQDLKASIDTLRAFDPETTVLFLYSNGTLAAYAEATAVLALLRTPDYEAELMGYVANSNADALRTLPGFQSQALSSERSNAEALQLMQKSNARSLVVTGIDNRPTGVVKRDQITAKMLLELADARNQVTS